MKLTVARYSSYLFFQLFFLFVDLLINCYSYLARENKLVTIILFLCQDICLVLALATFFFGLHSTFIYEVGLIEILYSKFRAPIFGLIGYFCLTVAYHTWMLSEFPRNVSKSQWPNGLIALWFTQRLFSPIYYFLFKRSALRLSDERFYHNLEWINEKLAFK